VAGAAEHTVEIGQIVLVGVGGQVVGGGGRHMLVLLLGLLVRGERGGGVGHDGW
jgi:hypothetical protein